MNLRLINIVRRTVSKPTGDRRRKLNIVVASYLGEDGYEYRKQFESYDTPDIPEQGTSKELTAKQKQWC